MNIIPVIHLYQWVRRGESVPLVDFNNSQTRLPEESRSAEKRIGTTDTSSSLLTAAACGGGSDWCQHWYNDGTSLALLAHWAGSWKPEGRESRLPVPVCSISAQYLSHSDDQWRVLRQQLATPAGGWPPDLCLISSAISEWDPYCQLSLA